MPLIIVGQGALARADGAAVFGHAAKLAAAVGAVNDGWNGFAVLHTAASRVGGLDIGFVPGEGGKNVAGMLAESEVLFLLGADELDLKKRDGRFIVYIGTHGDAGAHNADVILPGAAYTEKSGTLRQYGGPRAVGQPRRLRTGRRQGGLGYPAGAVGCARPQTALRFAAAVAGQAVCRLSASEEHRRGRRQRMPSAVSAAAKLGGKFGKAAFTSPVTDFYLTNPIARASAVMAECSALARDGFKQAAE